MSVVPATFIIPIMPRKFVFPQISSPLFQSSRVMAVSETLIRIMRLIPVRIKTRRLFVNSSLLRGYSGWGLPVLLLPKRRFRVKLKGLLARKILR